MDLKNQTVSVTGGAGFIGSALVRELLREGCRVVIYDNFVSGDIANLEEIRSEVEIVEGDIRDSNFAATPRRTSSFTLQLSLTSPVALIDPGTSLMLMRWAP